MADNGENGKLTEKQLEWRRIVFEEIEKVINANRDLITSNAAKRLQQKGMQVK